MEADGHANPAYVDENALKLNDVEGGFDSLDAGKLKLSDPPQEAKEKPPVKTKDEKPPHYIKFTGKKSFWTTTTCQVDYLEILFKKNILFINL